MAEYQVDFSITVEADDPTDAARRGFDCINGVHDVLPIAGVRMCDEHACPVGAEELIDLNEAGL